MELIPLTVAGAVRNSCWLQQMHFVSCHQRNLIKNLSTALGAYLWQRVHDSERWWRDWEMLALAAAALQSFASYCLFICLQCAAHWQRVKDTERWTRDWGMLALAAADRVELALGEHMDTLYRLMQPHAEAFQAACAIDEVGRGSVTISVTISAPELCENTH